ALEHAEEFQPEPRPVERRRNTLGPLGETKAAKLEQTRLRSRPLSHDDPNQAAVAASHALHAPDDRARRAPGLENQFAEFDSQAPLGARQVKQLDVVFHHDRMVESLNKALEAFLQLAEGIEIAKRGHIVRVPLSYLRGRATQTAGEALQEHIGHCGARVESQKPCPSPRLPD